MTSAAVVATRFAVWTNRPYELRDTHDQLVSKKRAMELVQSEYKVPELIR